MEGLRVPIIVLLSITGCAAASETSSLLKDLDMAVMEREVHTAERIASSLLKNKELETICRTHLYLARLYEGRSTKRTLQELRFLRRYCGTMQEISAWRLWILARFQKDPAKSVRLLQGILILYPETPAAHPAVFALEEACRRAGNSPVEYLLQAYRMRPRSSIAPMLLQQAAVLSPERNSWQIKRILAEEFPRHPFGRLARIELLKRLAPKDPEGAVLRLYEIGYSKDRSLFFGTYNLGIRGKALLEAARIWDRYLDDPIRAEALYREFIRRYPGSDKCDDALYEAYLMYIRRRIKDRAHALLVELARRFPFRKWGLWARDLLGMRR